MIWNKNDGYIRYVSAETNLKNFLGISQVDYFMDSEKLLEPYITSILEYINKKLIIFGIDSDMKLKIEEVLRLFGEGSEKIIHEETMNLVKEVGISTDPDDEAPFVRDRFVFCWSNLFTGLCMRLKLQYAHLFAQEDDGECCKCGARGEHTHDYESWVSHVFPDDEEYDRNNYFRTNTVWGTLRDYNECGCMRRPSVGENTGGED